MSKLGSYRKEIRFFVYFILFFLVFQALHFFARPYITPFVVHHLTTGGSSKLINLITPAENTRSEDEYLISGHFRLEIARGCEGIEGVIILLAAILAFPSGMKWKLMGITGGVLALYVLNLFRIAGLYYILKYKPVLFDLMHIYVGQTFIIAMAFLYFVVYLSFQVKIDAKKN